MTRGLARIIHRPVADFVRSQVAGLVYGQNSHEFCYAMCAFLRAPVNNPG